MESRLSATEGLSRQELRIRSVHRLADALVQRQGSGLQDQEVAGVRQGSRETDPSPEEAGPGLEPYLQSEKKFQPGARINE